MFNNIKSAFSNIWNNKITSLLTILGVAIGVTSVIVLISLGQGLKNDVSSLIQELGSNVIAVVGGKIDTSDIQNNSSSNPAQFVSFDILTLSDVEVIESVENIESVAPMSMVSTNVKYEDKIATPMIIGTSSNFLDAIEILKLEFGEMPTDEENDRSIVVSYNTKEKLFDKNEALGEKVMLGKEEFTVSGILEKRTDSVFGGEYDDVSIISFNSATLLNKDQVKIFRIIIKAKSEADPKVVKEAVRVAVLENHDNEDDFSVLTQDDLLGLIDQFLSLATTMVTAIAAVSLIVGGIGIMNIMLITVTERTKEIGLRKAVGASRSAILFQFLVEAVIITVLGGIIGLIISFITTSLIKTNSTLTPQITPYIIVLALGISTMIGILFGIWPALRAAKKDPIEALRHE